MKILMSCADGYVWEKCESSHDVLVHGLELNSCAANPQSQYVRYQSDLGFLVLKCYGLTELGVVTYKSNAVAISSAGSLPPRLYHLPYVLQLLNTLDLTPVDTEPNRGFSYLGIYKYQGEWKSTRQLEEGITLEGNQNWNNLIVSLPYSLFINGDLSLCRTRIRTLPVGLYVSGKLDVRYNPRLVLPDVIHAKEILHD